MSTIWRRDRAGSPAGRCDISRPFCGHCCRSESRGGGVWVEVFGRRCLGFQGHSGQRSKPTTLHKIFYLVRVYHPQPPPGSLNPETLLTNAVTLKSTTELSWARATVGTGNHFLSPHNVLIKNSVSSLGLGHFPCKLETKQRVGKTAATSLSDDTRGSWLCVRVEQERHPLTGLGSCACVHRHQLSPRPFLFPPWFSIWTG